MLYTHTHTVYTWRCRTASYSTAGAGHTAIHLSLSAMDRLIGLILRGKEYPELFRLNNSVEMLNPSQEFLCEREKYKSCYPDQPRTKHPFPIKSTCCIHQLRTDKSYYKMEIKIHIQPPAVQTKIWWWWKIMKLQVLFSFLSSYSSI